jgi:hypothetical protein
MKNWSKFAVTLVILITCLVLILGPGSSGSSAAPTLPQSIVEPSPVVMTALPWDDPTIRIPAPPQFKRAHAPTASFSINYLAPGTTDFNGATCLAWDPSAQAAYTYAASVWATLINSSVPIKINACWSNLGSPSILGYSGSYLSSDFPGAPRSGTWYSF